MAKKDKEKQIPEKDVKEPEVKEPEKAEQAPPAEDAAPEAAPEAPVKKDPWEEKYNQEHDAHLRLAAEYDNFRKRTIKEKEASYGNGKSDAVQKMLPVYDNLERALKQETTDEAYAKGVQMIMTQLKTVLEKLGIEEIPALGETFDPNFHNAVMHMEDDSLGENTVAEVFQTGFKIGDKVIRHAMVKVAN